jgi:outer membrane protein
MAVETATPPQRAPRRRRIAGAAALAAAGFALALASAAASAQSLRELYEAAHAYDATYLAARALADSATYRVEQTRALNRASASLAGNVARVESNPTAGSNFSSNGFGLSVNGRQPLFNRSNDATIAQAELSLESSLADLDTAEQDLMLRVSQAYFDVLGAQDTLQTTRANKAAISEQLASAKRNFEVGTATITDTREAQARFDLATAQEIAADNDLVTKRIALDQLVGPQQRPAARARRAGRAAGDGGDPGRRPRRPRAEEHPAVRRARVAFDVAQLETRRRVRNACRPSMPWPRCGRARHDRRQRHRLQLGRQHRRPGQRAALHRRLDPEPDPRDARPRGALAQRPRGGAAVR